MQTTIIKYFVVSVIAFGLTASDAPRNVLWRSHARRLIYCLTELVYTSLKAIMLAQALG
jgi:hypothetical protein